MSCYTHFCSDTGLKRHSSSNSSSGPKRGKYENPDSKPSGSQKSKSSIENFMSLYIFVKLLASGGFGIVNLMQDRITKQFYAVKVVKKKNPNADDMIRNEISLGMNLDSKYVCKVYEAHEDDTKFFIVMQYLEGQDLCNFIRKNPTFFKNNPKSFWFVVEFILRGLAYLHSQGIAHFDVKTDNIFLLFVDKGNIIGVKLIDLGLSILVDDTKMYFRGTCYYMAPEFLNPFCFRGFPSDIWSLGMTAYAMLMASLPISSNKKNLQDKKDEIYRKIGNLLTLKEDSFNPFSRKSEDPTIAQIHKFISLCFSINPNQRPTADGLLKEIPKTTSQINP